MSNTDEKAITAWLDYNEATIKTLRANKENIMLEVLAIQALIEALEAQRKEVAIDKVCAEAPHSWPEYEAWREKNKIVNSEIKQRREATE
jgi:hypothetical protein